MTSPLITLDVPYAFVADALAPGGEPDATHP